MRGSVTVALLALLAGCGVPAHFVEPIPASSVARWQPPEATTASPPASAATAPRGRPAPNPQARRADARTLALDPSATDRLSGTSPPHAQRVVPAMPTRSQWQREHEYCDDFAFRVHLATVGVQGASRFARQNAYEDCMAGFARLNRFIAP